jgi:hypothetical protein
MADSRQRPGVETSKRSGGATLRHFNASTILLIALFSPVLVRAQLPLPDRSGVRSSVSGQFVVISPNPGSSSSDSRTLAATNAEWVRLDPALLAISAERVKQPLWRQLGVDPATPWRGRIFLALHPAASPDENVAIISTRVAGVWTYRVELPDVMPRLRLTRALTGVVLLELANRDNPGDRCAEVPAWLTEGLAQQLLSDAPEMIVSPPDRLMNGLPENQFMAVQRGVDALAKARSVLHNHPALTVDQLSWPDDAQLRDEDGGIYRASAQLFVNNLLALKDGAKNLLAMLQMLPRCYNWQTAFRAAFAADFRQPIDVEKWWALQIVSFGARDAGPLWTPASCRDTLDRILTVPVEMRSAPTNLPEHAAISLQSVIRNFKFDQQAEVLKIKLHDLEFAQWRMAPPFAGLTDAYRRVIADYLGEGAVVVRAPGRVPQPQPGAPSRRKAAAAINKLDALDAQRRAMSNAGQPDFQTDKKPNEA